MNGNIWQVYLILDEFMMGGEIQETSKKVCICQSPSVLLQPSEILCTKYSEPKGSEMGSMSAK